VGKHIKAVLLLSLAALLAGAGCGGDNFALSAETDEPLYRQGQQLEKQGRTQEALIAYLKLISRRGDSAPESHLEAGLIYLEHGGDPISAIYHFRKYIELAPNSRQAASVRGLIDTAKLNFARSLPVRPLDNPDLRIDESAEVSRLRQENQTLRAELAEYRSGGSVPAPAEEPAPRPAFVTPHVGTGPAAAAQDTQDAAAAPITPAPLPEGGGEAADAPARPVITKAPEAAAAGRPAPAARTHTVVRGDTLYSIAQRYYGVRSRAKVAGIVEANRGVLSGPSSPLRIGMQLRIP
jgi:tetratricopeptide (TPR) repeat protein